MKRNGLNQLTAADVMHRDLVVVYDRDSLREAMELMTENHVTGLPVVNPQGVCVGVVTASDILNYEQEHANPLAEGANDAGRHFNPDTQRWESVRLSAYALEAIGDVRVEAVMTPELVSVTPETSLRDAARKMHAARVHRVLVLNEQQRLMGIVSAFDFVRLFSELE